MSETKKELTELIRRGEAIANEIEKLKCERSLFEFVKSSWSILEPGAPLGDNWHIHTICGYLEAVANGQINRLIINIPPGMLKSMIVSVLFPAWKWIRNPEERFLSVTNEESLAIRDALKMKQVVLSEWYQRNWPISMQSDQNEKTLFINSKTGFRQSQGFSSNVTGKRGTYILIDDPHAAKMANSDLVRQSVLDKFDTELITRVNDPQKSPIILIMQRLHADDLTGHLLKKSKSPWVHLSIPMRYEGDNAYNAGKDIGRPELNDPRTKKGELLFPKRFTQEVVDALEETLGEYNTAGQHQQRPSPLGGGIIKKHYWRVWGDDQPQPICTHIFHSWDTAFSEADSKKAAYSAMTRWGIFWHEQRDRYCIMCLGMWYGRVGFDELRKQVKEFDKLHKPDINLVEKKATGITLVQELKRASPGKVRAYTPGRGEDKISRVHSVSPMLESGQVYVPAREWAVGNGIDKLGLIDYAAQFPNGGPPTADLVDTISQALIYMRSNLWAGYHDDDAEAPYEEKQRSEIDEEDSSEEARSFYG